MDAIFDLIGKVFNPILEMGGPVIMLIIWISSDFIF
ncbi:Uncharacterised protein [Streptococcus pneumoniae]|nr:Uncharacterised protein [Streptococcus pneumoniae]